MSWHKARLAKYDDDGIPIMLHTVPLGTEYIVNSADMRRNQRVYNTEVHRYYVRDFIWAVRADDRTNTGYLPTCIIDIDEGSIEASLNVAASVASSVVK